jgi:N-acetylmuramoyl-L-alanine amidase
VNAQPYDQLTDEQLVALCIWREARGELMTGKLAVGCVIRNRVAKPGWWGHDWRSVILKPFQFSSFNANDPNADKWPEDDDPSWLASWQAAQDVMGNYPDVTNGSTLYYSPPLTQVPRAWGAVVATANIGHLSLFKPAFVEPADLSMQGDV